VSQLLAALEQSGLVVEEQAAYPEQLDVQAWIQAAGPDDDGAQGGPVTINAVDTTTTPSPPTPEIAHLKTRS
jgi:hypothetical protein